MLHGLPRLRLFACTALLLALGLGPVAAAPATDVETPPRDMLGWTYGTEWDFATTTLRQGKHLREAGSLAGASWIASGDLTFRWSNAAPYRAGLQEAGTGYHDVSMGYTAQIGSFGLASTVQMPVDDAFAGRLGKVSTGVGLTAMNGFPTPAALTRSAAGTQPGGGSIAFRLSHPLGSLELFSDHTLGNFARTYYWDAGVGLNHDWGSRLAGNASLTLAHAPPDLGPLHRITLAEPVLRSALELSLTYKPLKTLAVSPSMSFGSYLEGRVGPAVRHAAAVRPGLSFSHDF